MGERVSKRFMLLGGLSDQQNPLLDSAINTFSYGNNVALTQGVVQTAPMPREARAIRGSMLPRFVSDFTQPTTATWQIDPYATAANTMYFGKREGTDKYISRVYLPIHRQETGPALSVQCFIKPHLDESYGLESTVPVYSQWIAATTLGFQVMEFVFSNASGPLFIRPQVYDAIAFRASGASIGGCIWRAGATGLQCPYYFAKSGNYGAIGTQTQPVSAVKFGEEVEGVTELQAADNGLDILQGVDTGYGAAWLGVSYRFEVQRVGRPIIWAVSPTSPSWLVWPNFTQCLAYDASVLRRFVDSSNLRYDVSYGHLDTQITPVAMNDRVALVMGGADLPLIWGTVSTNLWAFVTNMHLKFANGLVSDASGFEAVYALPQNFIEYKNKLHLIGGTYFESTGAGWIANILPRSVFPSYGFIPDQYDWENEIVIDGNEAITAAVEFRDLLFLFSKNLVQYLSYDSEGQPLPLQIIAGAPGTGFKEAAWTNGLYIFWANENGVYMTDGMQWTTISDPIRVLYAREITETTTDATRLIYVTGDLKESKLYVSIYNTSSDAGSCFIYDYASQAWSTSDITVAGLLATPEKTFAVGVNGAGFSIKDSRTKQEYWDVYAPEMQEVFQTSCPIEIKKACSLTDSYGQMAQAVYIRPLCKALDASVRWQNASPQVLQIRTYWDGYPSQNIGLSIFTVSMMPNLHAPVIVSPKIQVPGTGNILNVTFSRTPITDGEFMVELLGFEVDYEIVDRTD